MKGSQKKVFVTQKTNIVPESGDAEVFVRKHYQSHKTSIVPDGDYHSVQRKHFDKN